MDILVFCCCWSSVSVLFSSFISEVKRCVIIILESEELDSSLRFFNSMFGSNLRRIICHSEIFFCHGLTDESNYSNVLFMTDILVFCCYWSSVLVLLWLMKSIFIVYFYGWKGPVSHDNLIQIEMCNKNFGNWETRFFVTIFLFNLCFEFEEDNLSIKGFLLSRSNELM